MRKIYCLAFISFLFCIGATKAQYTNLHNFNDTNGQSPEADLILSGNVLYGMTPYGGLNADGCVFSINANGSNYKDLFDFNGTNGSDPAGSFVLLGGKLYGIAERGGTNGYGVIFSINTDGSGYKDLYNFDNTYGSYSRGTLTYSVNKFYGMAYQGGAYNGGCIFSIDTNGKGYKDILDFNGSNGAQPTGYLTISGKVLYGMTANITAYVGNIFAVDTDGTRFRELWLFGQYTNTDGAEPQGSLLFANGRLYGMTQQGGAFANCGMIFGIDTDGTGYKDLQDLSCPIGSSPDGSLIISGSTLYGMTTQGGGYVYYGCIFSIDTNGTGYNRMYPFNAGTNGSNPYGSLILSGTTLYGMAGQGGAHGDGVIFSYNEPVLGGPSIVNDGGTRLYPNPNNGLFNIQFNNSIKNVNSIEVYNILGEKFYTSVPNSITTQIDLSNKPAGIYLYRVLDLTGQSISEGKFIIK